VKNLQRLFAFVMIPLLAFFASGVSIHTHFCKGELVEASVFIPAAGCEMQAKPQASCEAPPIETDCGTTSHIKKTGCCEDHSDFFQLPTFSKASSANLLNFFALAVLPSNVNLLGAQPVVFLPAAPPHGPPLVQSGQAIRIAYQSFLC
jgi:hypothetical protein